MGMVTDSAAVPSTGNGHRITEGCYGLSEETVSGVPLNLMIIELSERNGTCANAFSPETQWFLTGIRSAVKSATSQCN